VRQHRARRALDSQSAVHIARVLRTALGNTSELLSAGVGACAGYLAGFGLVYIFLGKETGNVHGGGVIAVLVGLLFSLAGLILGPVLAMRIIRRRNIRLRSAS
jgi:hypothetical protein